MAKHRLPDAATLSGLARLSPLCVGCLTSPSASVLYTPSSAAAPDLERGAPAGKPEKAAAAPPGDDAARPRANGVSAASAKLAAKQAEQQAGGKREGKADSKAGEEKSQLGNLSLKVPGSGLGALAQALAHASASKMGQQASKPEVPLPAVPKSARNRKRAAAKQAKAALESGAASPSGATNPPDSLQAFEFQWMPSEPSPLLPPQHATKSNSTTTKWLLRLSQGTRMRQRRTGRATRSRPAVLTARAVRPTRRALSRLAETPLTSGRQAPSCAASQSLNNDFSLASCYP